MRLAEFWNRVKGNIAQSPDLHRCVFVPLFLCFLGFGALLLLRIVHTGTSRKAELQIVQNNAIRDSRSRVGETLGGVGAAGGGAQSPYVASKTGTVYYLPWCGGVKLIHEENKVWFESKEEAATKGYRPAANCKGI